MATIGEMLITIGVEDKNLAKQLKSIESGFRKLGKELTWMGKQLTWTLSGPVAALEALVFHFSKNASYYFSMFADSVGKSLGAVGTDLARAIDLEGMLKNLAAVIKLICAAFIALPDPIKKVIFVLASVVSIIGPLLLIIGKVIMAFGALVALFVGPLGVIAGISLAVITIVSLASAFRDAIPGLNSFFEALNKIVEELKDAEKWGNAARLGLSWWGVGGNPITVGAGIALGGGGGESATRAEEVDLSKLKAATDVYLETIKKINLEKEAGLLTDREVSEQLLRNEERNYVVARGAGATKEHLQAWGTPDKIKQLQGQIHSIGGELQGLMDKMQSVSLQVATMIFDTFQSLSKGIGDAVANAIVYGQDLATSMKSVLQAVAASIISTLIQIAVQYVISHTVMSAAVSALTALEIGSAVAVGAAWTWTSAVEELGLLGLLVGAALAAAFIAGAIGSSKSGAAQGSSVGSSIGKAASGGIFSRPGFTSIAEGGKPEIVLNEGNIRKYFPGLARGGNQTIIVQLDKKPIVQAAARGMPEYLEIHGAT
jgi:hypothetical protein